MMTKKVYLEILRCIALLLVVLIHVVAIPIQNWGTTPGIGYPLYSLLYTSGNLGVPLFLMISGTLLLNPNKEISLEKIYKKMIPRILIPLVFFGYCFALLEMYFNMRTISVKMFGDAVLRVLNKESWGHLWYMYLLLGIYLFLPIIRILLTKMTDREIVYMMSIFTFLGFGIPTINAVFKTSINLEQPSPLCHITVFMMGYLILRYHKVVKFRKCIYLWYDFGDCTCSSWRSCRND